MKIDDMRSEWVNIKADVPQGTLLGPHCFVLHINDLHTDCATVKYVDDSTLWESSKYTSENCKLHLAVDQAITWTDNNNMGLNYDKLKELMIWFGKRVCSIAPIVINNTQVICMDKSQLLGVIVLYMY